MPSKWIIRHGETEYMQLDAFHRWQSVTDKAQATRFDEERTAAGLMRGIICTWWDCRNLGHSLEQVSD